MNHHQEQYHDRYRQLWGNIQLGGATFTYDRRLRAILGILVLLRYLPYRTDRVYPCRLLMVRPFAYHKPTT